MTEANSTVASYTSAINPINSTYPEAQKIVIDLEHIINQTVVVTIACIACFCIIFGMGKTVYTHLKPYCEENLGSDSYHGFVYARPPMDFNLGPIYPTSYKETIV